MRVFSELNIICSSRTMAGCAILGAILNAAAANLDTNVHLFGTVHNLFSGPDPGSIHHTVFANNRANTPFAPVSSIESTRRPCCWCCWCCCWCCWCCCALCSANLRLKVDCFVAIYVSASHDVSLSSLCPHLTRRC